MDVRRIGWRGWAERTGTVEVAIWVIVGIVGLLIVGAIVSYNRFISQRQFIRDSWANIDTELRRRYDLIPNLIETVKGYASHERELFEEVARTRAAAAGATGSPAQQAAAEAPLIAALGRLFAVAGAYPQLGGKEGERLGLSPDDDRPTEQFALPAQVLVPVTLYSRADLLPIGVIGVLRQPLVGAEPMKRLVAIPVVQRRVDYRHWPNPGSLEALDGLRKCDEVLAPIGIDRLRKRPRPPVGLSHGHEARGAHGWCERGERSRQAVPDEARPQAKGNVIAFRSRAELAGVRVDELDQGIHPGLAGPPPGLDVELLGPLDAGDPAPEFAGEQDGRPAAPRCHVEYT